MKTAAIIAEFNLFQTITFIVLAIIMWYKHFINIKRIANGEEIGFLRKNKNKAKV